MNKFVIDYDSDTYCIPRVVNVNIIGECTDRNNLSWIIVEGKHYGPRIVIANSVFDTEIAANKRLIGQLKEDLSDAKLGLKDYEKESTYEFKFYKKAILDIESAINNAKKIIESGKGK